MTGAIDCDFSVEGAGPPLFLIHGIGAARSAWRFMMPRLTREFTVVSYDLRGHGQSPMPEDEFGLADLVADLERVRARSGIERAHFTGHSLGGMIGPAYARKFPDRVLSLGMLSTAAGRTEDDSAKVWGVIKAMEDKGIANVLPALTDRWFTDDYIAKNPGIVDARLQQVIDCDAKVFMNVFRIYAGTEMMPWLHEISAPALILTGELDGACNPRLNKAIVETMPIAELVILPGRKHAITLEAPDDITDNLIRFCGMIDAAN